MPGVKQGRVNAVDAELGRDVQLGPQPVLGFVGRPGDLVVVIPGGDGCPDGRYVDGYDTARRQGHYRYAQHATDGPLPAAAGGFAAAGGRVGVVHRAWISRVVIGRRFRSAELAGRGFPAAPAYRPVSRRPAPAL